MTTHTVHSGDTLGKIAKHYLGNAALYHLIAEQNHITDPNKIAIGMELIIPEMPEAPAAALTIAQLQQILHSDDEQLLNDYLDPLNRCFERYQINTPLRIAHFLAQICHESNDFKAVRENLNYSARALKLIFGKYFQSKSVHDYARQPEKIANHIYANRMGNADEVSGEGWAYRGRGLIQLTGKDNYRQFSDSCGIDVVSNPDRVAEQPQLCVAAAGWYWHSRHLNDYADQDDVQTITKRINGGLHGLAARQAKLAYAKQVLGV